MALLLARACAEASTARWWSRPGGAWGSPVVGRANSDASGLGTRVTVLADSVIDVHVAPVYSRRVLMLSHAVVVDVKGPAGRPILPLAVVDPFRQEGEIWFSSPDGVDGELPLAPALILYGPNDAGKSNTLRAITGLLRGGLLDPREPFDMVWSETKWNLSCACRSI